MFKTFNMIRRKTALIVIVACSLLVGLLFQYDLVPLFRTDSSSSNGDESPQTTGSSNVTDAGSRRQTQHSSTFIVGNAWKLVPAKSARSVVNTAAAQQQPLSSYDDVDVLARNKVKLAASSVANGQQRRQQPTRSIVTFTLHVNDVQQQQQNMTNKKYRLCNLDSKQQREAPSDELLNSFNQSLLGSKNSSSILMPIYDTTTIVSVNNNNINEDKLLVDYADVATASADNAAAANVDPLLYLSPDFDTDPFEPKSERVLNPYPFRYLIEESDACCRALERQKPKDGRLKAVILVHTHPEAFDNRQVIRDTWATPRWQNRFYMLTLFVMGRSANESVQEALARESDEHGDIVQSSFLASYWNNTYNTMAALKWATTNCRDQTHFIVKTDDDFVINIFRFNIYLTGILNKRGLEQSRHDMFVRCASLFRKARPIRDRSSKWYVSKQVWPRNYYPSICLGGAVMFTPTSAERLYEAAHYYEFFPLDDVFVTGIVAQNISDFKLIHMPGPNGWVMCQADPKCLIKNRVMFYHTMQDRSVMLQFWNFLESQYERKLQLLGFQ